MTDETAQENDSAGPEADALAAAEQAEAEALAVAARARAKATALRRAANTATEPDEVDEDDEDAGDADDVAAPELAPEHPRVWVSRALPAVAIGLICGLLGLSGYVAWHHHTAIERREHAAAFAAAARQELINLTSYNFHHAKEDVQRVIDNSTGEFKDDFGKRAADFASVVEQSKVISEGRVNAVAVESMEGDSAVVLVSATSNVTNAAGAKQDPRAFRMRLTVAREGDGYKVSKLEVVP